MKKTNNKIKLISGLVLESLNLTVIPDDNIFLIPITLLSSVLVGDYLLDKIDKNKTKHDEEMTGNIKKLYKIFIDEYHKLNKTVELEDPYELYLLFVYMLNKGYLSNEKKFVFSTENVKDIDGIIGANINVGTGVCRHISRMLTDIYKNEGIDAHELSVYHRDYKVVVHDLGNKNGFSYDEINSWVDERLSEEEDRNKVKVFVNELILKGKNISLKIEPIESNIFLERIIGNHVINVFEKDGFIYFIDPTNECLYRYSKNNDKVLMQYELEIPISKFLTRITINSDEYKKVMKLIGEKLPTISVAEERCRKNKIDEIIKDDPNLLEQFYEEHKELYKDISNELSKVKKRGLFYTKN